MNNNYFIPLFDKDIVLDEDEYNNALLYISKNTMIHSFFNDINNPSDSEDTSYDNFEEQYQNINMQYNPGDALRSFEEDLKDECKKNQCLYPLAIPIYANYIRTQDLYNQIFSYLIDLALEPYPDIKYHTVSVDMRILKDAMIRDIAAGNKDAIENIFSKTYYSEYQYAEMLLHDDKIGNKNIMNPLMNCECKWLYMSINVNNHLKFIKKLIKDNILKISKENLSELLKNKKDLIMCYRLLPSPNPGNLYNLVHKLQLYL